MIGLSDGKDLDALLDRMARKADRLREALICSPFIDEDLDGRIAAMAEAITACGGRLLIVTSKEPARALRPLLSTPARRRATVVTTRRRLHAKAYVAVARRARECEAIVTSANLTNAGLGSNIELGVRAIPTTDAGHRLYDQTCRFIHTLA